jgi:hypothetical protein
MGVARSWHPWKSKRAEKRGFMVAIVGANCDIALWHPEVDGGEPVGLLVEPKVKYGPPVTVHWEAYSEADGSISEVRHLWFVVLLEERATNPDGSIHAETVAEMYAKLVQIVMKHKGIGLVTRIGSITGLKSSGHVMIQNIYPGIQTVEVNLTTRLTNFAPVDTARYIESKWVDSTTYVGAMNWNNSYWRG